METFSAGSCIRFGWETFKKRPGFFIGVTILILIFSALFDSITNLADKGTLMYLVLYVISFALTLLIDIGSRALALKAHDNTESVQLSDLWHPQSYFSYLAAVILTGIVIVVGLILVIIPGIIFGLMFMFVKLVVIDQKLGPIEAMKESARITKGSRWELFAFVILVVLLNILGAILLLVGLLVTIPVTMLASVHAYKVLKQKAGPAPTPVVA